jgi:tetratricopeptide (TPR) repeat protein
MIINPINNPLNFYVEVIMYIIQNRCILVILLSAFALSAVANIQNVTGEMDFNDDPALIIQAADDYFNEQEFEKSIGLLNLVNPDDQQVSSQYYLLKAEAYFELMEDEMGLHVYFKAMESIQTESDASLFYRDLLYLMTSNEYEQALSVSLDRLSDFYIRFWQNRDPYPESALNERIPEHYRRLNYARKHYTRKNPGKSWYEQAYEINHRVRSFIPVRTGYRLIKSYTTQAVLKDTDLDDMGLIYIRHGDPDKKVINMHMGLEQSWRYNACDDRSEMIFHFYKQGESRGWIILNLPNSFEDLAVLGSKYGMAEMKSRWIWGYSDYADMVRLCHELSGETEKHIELALSTETSTYQRDQNSAHEKMSKSIDEMI